MQTSNPLPLTERKWFYPLIYFLLVIVAFLPLYTEIPYDPRQTSQVFNEVLQRSIEPYAAWGWVFHLLPIAALASTVWRPAMGGRALALTFGLNYLVIAATQTHAVTPNYGFTLLTGVVVACGLLAGLWLWISWKGELSLAWSRIPAWRWFLMPLAVLAFWSPMRLQGELVLPDFDPLLLLTSANYSFAYCFVTPVFLFLLILAYPAVNRFALRVTAFNGLLYGLFNLNWWSNPTARWLGVLHLPLLLLSLAALLLSHRRLPSIPK
ncbi:MAG: hypothetical protein ANABAC_1908 [Anaerolineae bacterium]|nr:MAG: hypothetical protein ANABAC_1908 [Anaerolineae bacterium]